MASYQLCIGGLSDHCFGWRPPYGKVNQVVKGMDRSRLATECHIVCLPADNPLGWDSQFTSSGRGVVVCLHCSKFCTELFVLFSFTVGCDASPSSMQALTATRSGEVSMGVTNI